MNSKKIILISSLVLAVIAVILISGCIPLPQQICELEKEYRHTAVEPIQCECPEGYEFEVIEMGWGPCPRKGMGDCPASTKKCVLIKERNHTIIIQNEEVSLRCNSNDDCQLINKELGFACCWEGYCDSIDYSLDKYIAVNKDSFLGLHKDCPEMCGPPPGCPITLINDNFEAKCVNDTCTKVPK